MKELMVNRRKETILILFVIIILLLIAAGISYNHYVEKHRKVVPKENYYSDFVVTGEKTVPEEDKKDDNNYQTTNQPTKKPKTEFEQVLEKYTLGDSEYGQMGDWLPKLLNNKLTDENKTIIVLKNQDYVTKRKETEL